MFDPMPIFPDQFRLDGRTALVTGSARGLGWEIAQALAQAGAQVLLHGRSAERLALRCELRLRLLADNAWVTCSGEREARHCEHAEDCADGNDSRMELGRDVDKERDTRHDQQRICA